VPTTRAAFSGDGKRLAGVDLQDKRQLVIWDSATGKETLRLAPLPGRIFHVAYSRDGKTVAAAGWANGRNYVQVWDAASGEPLADFQTVARADQLGALALGADGKLVAFDEYGEAFKFHVAEVRGKRIVKSFAGANDVIVLLAFSPNSRFLAAS